MSDLVWALNTVSGVVGKVNAHLLDHSYLGTILVAVEPHTKSYDPELWKPTTAEEYKASRSKASSLAPVNNAPTQDDPHDEGKE